MTDKSIVFLHDGDAIVTAEVDLDPNAPGFEVTCLDCGKRARLPDDPGTRGALCPECLIAEVAKIERRSTP